MRCLITGPDGFIGSHCVEHLLVNTDWELVLVASWRHDGIPERIADSEHVRHNWERLTVITHDLTAPISEVQLARLGEIDYVIHFAADSNVDRSITSPRRVIENNVGVTLTVLEACRVLKPQAVIQISTDEVYGPAHGLHRHKEWEPLIPSNPYSASKASQEAIAISYWRTYGVPVVITNTMNNFGERQSFDKFIPMVIRKVLRGVPVDIHCVGNAIGSRFYLHARNHADACLHILERVLPAAYNAPGREPPFDDRPTRLNVVGDVEVNNLELAQLIAKLLGRPLIHRLVDAHTSRPGHDLRYALDGAALSETGWVAPVAFENSLWRTVQWYKENQEWLYRSPLHKP